MRGLRRTTTALVAIAASLAAIGTGTAAASTLSASRGAVTYTGAANEANHLTLSFNLFYGTYMIEDTGASITVTSNSNQGCHPYTATMAYCDWGSVSSISARLGDRGSFAQSKLGMTAVTLTGGAGDDSLIGGGGTNTLVGAGGNDTLTAGSGTTRMIAASGNVTMIGGSGHDTYQGGPGNDTIHASNGVAEDVSCGDGVDSVSADPSDTVTADCESVDRGAAQPTTDTGTTGGTTDSGTPAPAFTPPLPAISAAPVTMVANRVPIKVACPETASGGCTGSIALSLLGAAQPSGKVSAARRVKRVISHSKRFRIKAGKKAVVRVALSRRGARNFRHAARRRRSKSLKVLATVTTNSGMGPQKTTRTITVRAERRSRGNQKARRKR